MNINERNLYLNNVDLDDAITMYITKINNLNPNKNKIVIPVINALDYVTSEPVFASVSSPYYNASAMDGICVKSRELVGVNERTPKILKNKENFLYVDTGDTIKEPFDAVIMIEDVVQYDRDTLKINKPVAPWQHVRPIGEDIIAGELILHAYRKIRPMDIGALLAGGIFEIEVFDKPKVGIIPTGTEIIENIEEIEEGKIIDSNSRMFEALVLTYGGNPNRCSPIIDDYEMIKSQVIKLLDENDIVIIGAGSSAGTEDYTRKIIEELGEVILHGVAIKPGKPVILGIINDKPVIGIPGYPVSAYFVFENFVRPIIDSYLHRIKFSNPEIQAVLSKRIVSSLKYLEFVRMKVGKVKDKYIATPLNRGAGVTMSLVNADGILRVPKNSEGYEAGKQITVQLIRPIEEIEKTLVSIGSHDILIDIVSNILHKTKEQVNLSSSHVGSLGGLMAFDKGECHIAPIHILDEDTGIYNIPFIKKYINNDKIILVKGVKRLQGLIVPKGNPKNIRTLEDLISKDIIFVNRQRGAGTRMLLDRLLREKKIDTHQINGYTREMNTHMMVASAIKSGTADTGLGVLSAANMMDLDFIPIGEEEYDFLVDKSMLNDIRFKSFLDVLKSIEFIKTLNELGGYVLEQPGKVIEINNETGWQND